MDPVLAHWKLNERPFELVTDVRFFCRTEAHDEALARLEYLVNERTLYFGMLSGEIGSGKSLTRRVFSRQIDPQQHFVVELENAAFGFDYILGRILKAAGWGEVAERAHSVGELYDLVAQLIKRLHDDQPRQLVLLIDEAQDADLTTLRGLKQLSNLSDEGEGTLTVVLIGQPELRSQVAAFPPLDQRITLRFHVKPLSREEVARYLRHRLRVAGHPSGDVFATDALELLAESSRGVGREINRLAKLALEAARVRGAHRVEVATMYEVLDDLRRQGGRSMAGLAEVS